MAGLRDQLLKAGLVNEKQVKKAQKEKLKERNTQTSKIQMADETRRQQTALAEKHERDRLLNQQLKEAAEKKALASQIRQLIEAHRINWQEGEVPFNFTDNGTVKRLHIDSRLRDQLIRGILGIARVDMQYEIVPRETAERIRQRDPSAVILLNNPATDRQLTADEDPYAKFQVPDDLVW